MELSRTTRVHLPWTLSTGTDAGSTGDGTARRRARGPAGRTDPSRLRERARARLVLCLVVVACGTGCASASVLVALPSIGLPPPWATSPAAMGLRVFVLEVSDGTDVPVVVRGHPVLAPRDADQEEVVWATTHGATGGVPDAGPAPVERVPGAGAEASPSWRDTVTAHTAHHPLLGTAPTIDVTAWRPAP